MNRALGQYTLAAAVIAAEFAAVSAINPMSGLAYLWFLLLAVGLYRLLIGNGGAEPVLLYGFYAFVTLVLFLAQRQVLPEYYGFSGGFGVGTDDSYYYSLAAEALPADFPVRPDYHLRTAAYPTLLRVFGVAGIRHPLDILFFNVMCLTLLPVLTSRVARRLTGNARIARLSYVLILICPLVLQNGVVLTRDGVTASLFIGTLALFLERRYVVAAALFLLLFYLRVASGLQLAVALVVFSLIVLREFENRFGKGLFLAASAAAAVVGAIIIYPMVMFKVAESGFLTTGLFRTQFITEYLAFTADNSILGQLGSVPALIRTPVSVAYFLSAPFLGLDQLTVNGVLVPRGILTTLFALLSIGYIKFFVQGIVSILEKKDFKMGVAVTAYLLLIVIIAHISLVIRHKTMLMPLFYIVVAYGVTHGTRFGAPLGNAAAAGLAGVQLIALMQW